jgi:hypothetical protein
MLQNAQFIPSPELLFLSVGDGTQHLVPARQALYHPQPLGLFLK